MASWWSPWSYSSVPRWKKSRGKLHLQVTYSENPQVAILMQYCSSSMAKSSSNSWNEATFFRGTTKKWFSWTCTSPTSSTGISSTSWRKTMWKYVDSHQAAPTPSNHWMTFHLGISNMNTRKNWFNSTGCCVEIEWQNNSSSEYLHQHLNKVWVQKWWGKGTQTLGSIHLIEQPRNLEPSTVYDKCECLLLG